MRVSLRPARISDRPRIYKWLAESDATAEMMGPPTFPDHPVPTFEEFCTDYGAEAYSGSGDLRLFVICADGAGVGAVSYFLREGIAEIDIWIGGSQHWGKSIGTKSIEMLANELGTQELAHSAVMRPSARNRRAVAAYGRAGFEVYDARRHTLPGWCLTEGLDYADAVVMVRGTGRRQQTGD